MDEKTKKCAKCGRELPLSEFQKNACSPDGLQRECRECKAEYMREYNARKRASKGQKITTTVQSNPKFADKTPRELQDMLRELKAELIARGFNCDIKLTYLQNIKI